MNTQKLEAAKAWLGEKYLLAPSSSFKYKPEVATVLPAWLKEQGK